MKKLLTITFFLLSHLNQINAGINKEWDTYLSESKQNSNFKVDCSSEGFYFLSGVFKSDSYNQLRVYKYSPTGTVLMSSIYLSTTYEIQNQDLKIDSLGFIVLSYTVKNIQDKYDLVVKKLYPSMEVKFTVSDPDYGCNRIEKSYLALGNNQTVYLSGTREFQNDTTSYVISIDSAGALKWNYVYHAGQTAINFGLKMLPNGEILVGNNLYHETSITVNFLRLSAVGFLNNYYDYHNSSVSTIKCNDFDVSTTETNTFAFTGYAIVSGKKELVTAKISNESLKFTALFHEDTLDNEGVCIKFLENKLVVTGYSISRDSLTHSDVITILYDSKGYQEWKNSYSGSTTENIKPIFLYLKNDIISIIGNTDIGNDKGFIIRYDIQGDLDDRLTFDDTLFYNNNFTSSSVDYLGNIIISSLTTLDTNYRSELIKINDPASYFKVMDNYFFLLSNGLKFAAESSNLEELLYSDMDQIVDSMYIVSLERLKDSAEAHSIGFLYYVNAWINEYYNTSEVDYYENIMKRMTIFGLQFDPIIEIPFYNTFSDGDKNAFPFIAYSSIKNYFPFPCLNCNEEDSLKDILARENISWVVSRGPSYIPNPPISTTTIISSCSVRLDSDPNNRFSVCNPVPFGPATYVGGGGAQNFELELSVEDENQWGYSSGSWVQFPSWYTPPFTTTMTKGYARLSRYGSSPYWRANGWGLPSGELRIYKEAKPLYDREYYSYNSLNFTHFDDLYYGANSNTKRGDVLYLCYNNIAFNSIDEEIKRYGNAYGLFKLEYPGIDQPPIYISQPYSLGLRFSSGPDIGISYLFNFVGTQCLPSQYIEIAENNFVQQNLYRTAMPQALNIPVANIEKYLATTDKSFFDNYWLQNKIIVGISTGYGLVPSGITPADAGNNIKEFTASSTPPGWGTPTGSVVAELNVLNDNGYQVDIQFNNGGYQAGTILQVCVKANYVDGTSIENCENLTIEAHTTNPSAYFNHVVVDIRGNIKDYNSSILNYQVKVYH